MPHAILVRQTGGPEQLKWEEVEVGDPGPGQVLLKQTAIGLNFIDVYHRSGLYPQPSAFIPGVEGAGVVERVGPDVDTLKPGDRVAYAGPIGGYADWYDCKRLNTRFGKWFTVDICQPLTQYGEYLGAVLVKR